MPIVYETNKELGITFVVCRGAVGAAECLAHVSELTSDPDWPLPERRQISDWRGAMLDASVVQAALEAAAAIYGAHRDKLANLRVAILAQDEFETARAFGRLLNRYGASAIVFNTTLTACAWLGVDLDKVNAVLRRMRATGQLAAA